MTARLDRGDGSLGQATERAVEGQSMGEESRGDFDTREVSRAPRSLATKARSVRIETDLAALFRLQSVGLGIQTNHAVIGVVEF
jgi:hypothetical protein